MMAVVCGISFNDLAATQAAIQAQLAADVSV